MTLYTARRDPLVAIQVNGKPAPEYEDARVRFRFIDRIYKRDEAELELADPTRRFRDELLRADDFFKISWGYPGNMSRPRGFKLKNWTTSMDSNMGAVKLKLMVTSRDPISKSKGAQVPSEPHKTHLPRNWGRVSSSAIAKKIARRHKLKFLGDESDDRDRTDFVQPGNVSDYGYLRRLAENIDFEFFIESGVLYYRKKPYNERPRRVFTFVPPEGDGLLLSFQPDVKVTTVRTKPNSVDVEQGEPPWSVTRQAAVELAAGVFKAEKKEIEEAVDALTNQASSSWQTAQNLKDALNGAPTSTAAQQDADDANAALTGILQELAVQKREARSSQKTVDKQGRANRTKKFGDNDKGGANCPKGSQFSGREPTGNSKSSAQLVFETDVRGRKADRIGKNTVSDRLGLAESTVQVSDSTEKQRRKKACAAHGKKKDKAVTARAEFLGDPALRAKVTYRFQNVGRLFNGNWYCKEAVHDLPAGLYTVSMSLKRGSLRGRKKGAKSGGGKDKKTTDPAKQELVNKINVRNGEESIAPLKPKVPEK